MASNLVIHTAKHKKDTSKSMYKKARKSTVHHQRPSLSTTRARSSFTLRRFPRQHQPISSGDRPSAGAWMRAFRTSTQAPCASSSRASHRRSLSLRALHHHRRRRPFRRRSPLLHHYLLSSRYKFRVVRVYGHERSGTYLLRGRLLRRRGFLAASLRLGFLFGFVLFAVVVHDRLLLHGQFGTLTV